MTLWKTVGFEIGLGYLGFLSWNSGFREHNVLAYTLCGHRGRFNSPTCLVQLLELDESLERLMKYVGLLTGNIHS